MQEVVIGGWRPGQRAREGRIGSLLLGVQGPAGLEYAGHVGTGFSNATLDELGRLLEPLRRATSPFATELPRADAKDAVWVTPTLVGEVLYGEWTSAGRLRHPSWRGLRDDKSPEDVVPRGPLARCAQPVDALSHPDAHPPRKPVPRVRDTRVS